MKGIIEIDTTEKNDELIITSMDYHSQKRKDPLFYNMKDFVNIHTALKCNSLVILSGLSGTGKSAIVDIYAKAWGLILMQIIQMKTDYFLYLYAHLGMTIQIYWDMLI